MKALTAYRKEQLKYSIHSIKEAITQIIIIKTLQGNIKRKIKVIVPRYLFSPKKHKTILGIFYTVCQIVWPA